MKRRILCCLLLLIGAGLYAQPTLSPGDFLAVVRKFHPVSRQAAISVSIARADVLSARGAFDPRLEHSSARKEFDGLLYYDHRISELTIPTWYGVELVGGIESLSGERTSTPDTKGNTSYIGFSIPIAKGLLMDERRASLQAAKAMQQMALQEQETILNDLLYDAAAAYWDWWQQYHAESLYRQAVANARQRFSWVKRAYETGERPAIDTVEALAQLQSIEIRASELQLALAKARLELSSFLWGTNGEAYLLPEQVIPVMDSLDQQKNMELSSLLQQLPFHPKLQQYRFQLEALQVDKKLKFQSLLPSVNLKYRQLNESHNIGKAFATPWLQNNYRYGVSVALPLRLSEGRGGYEAAKLKLQQAEWKRTNEQLQLRIKLQQRYADWLQVQQQVALQERALQSYNTLLKGEAVLFQNGESSLFLVNAREMKALEAEQKLIELRSKEAQSEAGVLWAAGVLPRR